MNSTFDLTYHVVLWSPSQKTFHVSTVLDMLKRNTRVCLEDKPGDFITLSFHPSSAEAEGHIETIKQTKNKEG